jgi:hypothetical protein
LLGAVREEVTSIPSSQECWGRTLIQAATNSKNKPSQHFIIDGIRKTRSGEQQTGQFSMQEMAIFGSSFGADQQPGISGFRYARIFRDRRLMLS